MRGLQDPVFEFDGQEQKLFPLANVQMLVVRALLYFATEKGKRWFVPVPAMIAVAIVKAVYEHAYDVKPHFLPQNRLDMEYPHYPLKIFVEGFWWDRGIIESIRKEMLAITDIPEAMRAVVVTLSAEHSILHPNGLLGIRMSSWWPARRCGAYQDNLRVYLTKENCMEAESALIRLGEENAAWCKTIGAIMGKCMDTSLISGRCSECHPSL